MISGFSKLFAGLLGALLGALVGCEGEAPAKAGPNGPPPARVWVDTVKTGSIEAEWSFLGDVTALQRARLAAGASGEVRRVLVRVGDRVGRGDLLVEIDPSLAAARVRAAEASSNAGDAELERARRDAERLSKAGPDIAAGAEIEQAESEKKRAVAERKRRQAAAAEARAELGRHRVKAPFQGVIAMRAVDPGDWVDPGVQVVELVDDRDVEVLASVPPEVSRYLSSGDKAMLRYRGDEVSATLEGIVPALDDESRTVRLRLTPDESRVWLLPGAAVEVILTVERSETDSWVVPRDALVYGIAKTQVVKSVEGKAAPVPVTVLARGREQVLVRAAELAAGDTVVTRGNERVFPGQSLIVLED